jgi:hypothetical protein
MTTEPDGEPNNEDEIMFTGDWFTPVVPVDNNDGGTFPVAYCCPTASVPVLVAPLIVCDVNDDEFLGLPVLHSRRDDDSSDDSSDNEGDDEFVPKKRGHHQKRKAPFDIKMLMLEAEV